MIKKILLLLLFLTILACSSKPEKPIPEKQLEGWAGNPDNPNEKPFNYFYMRYKGKASGHLFWSSCTENTALDGKKHLIIKMVDDTLNLFKPLITPNIKTLRKKLINENQKKIRGVSSYDCKPLSVPDPQIPYSGYKECECLIFVHAPGGKDGIIARAKELDKD